MESLKSFTRFCMACAFTLLGSGCGPSVTFIDYLETDTYLSSSDQANHSDLSELKVSLINSGTDSSSEERILVKLPTGKRDMNHNLEEAFKEPGAILIAPFIILAEMFAEIFDCRGKALTPTLLTSAKLILDVTANESGASLANQVSLHGVAKPWWQNASWNRAHGFSSNGAWSQVGGDLDPAFTPIQADLSEGAGTIAFDVTSYFRSLLTTEAPHYGLEIKASGANLPSVALASTQFGIQTQRPRLKSTYNCITPTERGDGLQEESRIVENTFVLGSRR